MVTTDGDAFIATDNDGVDGSSSETKLINLGPIFNEMGKKIISHDIYPDYQIIPRMNS